MISREKRATIKDVAQRADVSPTTVSMVLNGKDGSIPEETRKRVRRAAADLDYSFDYTARAMVTRKTNTVGIVIPDISNMFFAASVRHIQVELAQRGYDIILCNSEERAENDLRYIRLLAGRNVDGLILTPSAEALKGQNAARIRAMLEGLGVPYLFLDRHYEDAGPKVAVDNAESSYRAAKYLLGRGHTKIGAISGPLTLNSSYNRLKGLKRALAEAGLTLPSGYLYEGKYDFETGRRGGEALMKEDVTAIFAFCDMQAYGVYESVKRAGKQIPHDLSVIGFDDTFYSALLQTPLTTMRQPVEQLAQEACRIILSLIAGEEAQEAHLPAELIARESVKSL